MAANEGISGLKKEERTVKRKLPAFLKPFIPKSSTNRLKIPSAFMRYVEGKVPSEALLKDHYGRIWPVKIGNFDNETCFHEGCSKFIKQNNLEPGDFVMFQFDGHNTFHVKLLGGNHCHKKGAGRFIHKIKEEKEELKNPKNEEENNKEESYKNYGGAKDRLRKRRKIVDPFGFDIFLHGGISQPKNPYFVTRLRPRRKDEVLIPRAFIEAYKIDLPEKIVLLDNIGMQQESNLHKWKDGRAWYQGGWKHLFNLNLVTEKDLCICEFVNSNDGRLYIQVKVVRKSSYD